MPKIPGVRHQDAVRVFEKLGYRIIRQSGHIIMSNGETRLTIPRANPVDAFTMGAIARDAGLTPDEVPALALTRADYQPAGARIGIRVGVARCSWWSMAILPIRPTPSNAMWLAWADDWNCTCFHRMRRT